ncbi:hypothetical protein B0H12DRAFT_1237888 [Mycena haematopus]|nr:hypothetical protein B0H12DRAFT_1237888 [Mycena haematopus]
MDIWYHLTYFLRRQTLLKSLAKDARIPGLHIGHRLWMSMIATIRIAEERAQGQAAPGFSQLIVPGSMGHCASVDPPGSRMFLCPTPTPSAAPPSRPTFSTGPVMDGFSGISEPSVGNVGTQRAASAARTLPYGPFAPAFTSHSGARTPFPRNLRPSAPVLNVIIACWPLVLCTSDYGPLTAGHLIRRISIKNEHVKLYAEHLKKYHLVFKVDVACRDSVPIPAAEFFYKIKEHLDLDRITIPLGPTNSAAASSDLHVQPFVLLKASISQAVFKLDAHPTINDNQFTYKEFTKLNTKLPNPLTTEVERSLPWIWIAPRYGHLIGPVSSFSTPAAPLSGMHPCFGIRILDLLPVTSTTRDDPLQPECYPGHCPEEHISPILDTLLAGSSGGRVAIQRPVTPPSQLSLIRHRSPQSQVISDGRRVRQRQQSAERAHSPIEIDFLRQAPSTHPDITHQINHPPPSTRPPISITPLEVGVDVLSGSHIVRWHDTIEAKVEHLARNTSMVQIHGKTVAAVATCILDMIVYFQKRDCSQDIFAMEDSDLQLQMLVNENAADLVFESFFKPVRLISIPVLTPTGMQIPARIKTFRAHGMFLALHCYLLQQGPLPISVWLLLCLINGKDALLIPRNILLYMDPGAYDILAPWYDFHHDMPVPPSTQPTHPLRLFIVEHMPSMQPNLISNNRTLEEHNGWIVSAFATVLLGHPAPWDHPEYMALQDGFNTALGTRRFTETLDEMLTSPFLLAMYDRRVHDVEEVSAHFRFYIITRALDLTTPYFMKLFRLRLNRYVHGTGHPAELHDQLLAYGVTEQEIVDMQRDSLLRANLILCCASDGDMRPTQDNWTIEFKFQGRNTRNSAVAGPLGFHTCFYSIDVHLDSGLREILLEPPEVDVGSRQSSVEIVEGLRDDNGSESERSPPFVNSRLLRGNGDGEYLDLPTTVTLPTSQDEDVPIEVDPAAIRAEMAFERRVDAPSLTYQERVEMLIAEIHRLEGRTDSESMQTAESPGAQGEDSNPDVTAFSTQTPANALYFVGIQTNEGRRSFVEVVATTPPDHTLIERISTGMLGRAVRGIRQNQADFYIGTSDCPVEVSEDYMNHVYGFRELGSWLDVETATNLELATLVPVSDSAPKMRLLGARRLNEHTPVYVLYIYHEQAQSLWTETPVAIPQALPAATMPATIPHSTGTLTSNIIAGLPQPSHIPGVTAVQAYLEERFGHRLRQIRHVQTLHCGTAYRHCTAEKHVIAICTTLGLNLTARECYDDIIQTAGLNKNTFGGIRTQVRNARDARRCLSRIIRGRDQTGWTPASNEEAEKDEDQRQFSATLDALLGEADIDETFLDDTTDSPQARALHMSYERFKSDVAKVLAISR